MQKRNNSKSGANAESEFLKAKTEKQQPAEEFYVPIDPSSIPWDRTPDNCQEMVNTYGTYEIQATCETENTFPAISQGLPSEEIMHKPSNFKEGIIPTLNKLEKDKL